MKKLLAFVVTLATTVPNLWAVGSHPMSGCGLGYMLFGKDSSSSVSPQTCAYTTNQSTYNQAFGITSGTSGCTPEGLVSIDKQTERYVEVNFDSLRRDIAAGQGEYLNGLVDLLGVKEIKKGAVSLLLKQDYKDLFPSQNTSFDQFLKSLQQKLSDNHELLA